MSDQRRTGAVISLEEIFRSREFGRRPARWDGAPVPTVEAADPPLLEEVFLSELFGHPEAIAAAAAPSHIGLTAASVGRPTLVLLRGGEDAERDVTALPGRDRSCQWRGRRGAGRGRHVVGVRVAVRAAHHLGTGQAPWPQLGDGGRWPAARARGHRNAAERTGCQHGPDTRGDGRRRGRRSRWPSSRRHYTRNARGQRDGATPDTGRGRSLTPGPRWRDAADGHVAGRRRKCAHAGRGHRRRHGFDRGFDCHGGVERPRARRTSRLAGHRIAQQRRCNGDSLGRSVTGA